MAIFGTNQPVTDRSLIEYTVGKPNDFPQSTSSRAFGNPSQANVPGFGSPSNVLLAFDQIQVEAPIAASTASLAQVMATGTAVFPNIQFPLITGASEAVYCLVLAPQVNNTGSYLPGQTQTSLTYRIQQANGQPISVTPGFVATGQTTTQRIQALPTNVKILGITLNYSQAFYATTATSGAGLATIVYTLLMVSNTGFVSLI